MVTNPATRDWTVTASTYATLNEMYGNRTLCGIGRGDSAVRVTNGRPSTAGRAARLHRRDPRPRQRRGGRVQGQPPAVPLEPPLRPSTSGSPPTVPRVLQLTGEVADGFILQLADLSIAEWSIAAVRKAAADAGRDPDDVAICVAAPAYITDGSEESRAHAYDQCRWFGGMVGNHVADIVARYGADGANVPTALTDYIKGREGYDYNEHGRAGNTHTSFVPDEIVDRFCVIGTVHEHLAKLDALRALGVNQFAIYLQHDAQDETLRAYGQHVVPAIAERVRATT